MLCPSCGAEFDETVARCTACGAEFKWADSDAAMPDDGEDVAVLSTVDPSLVPVVLSLLEAEGIPCRVSSNVGESAAGTPGGPIPYQGQYGPARILVARAQAEVARALLAAQVPPAAGEPGGDAN